MRLLLLALTLGVAQAQPYVLLPDVVYDTIDGVDPDLLSLDVYRPTGVGPFPVVVFVHGGGWHTGDKASAVHAKADWLSARGVMLVSVNYRLSPTPTAAPASGRVTFPTHPDDVGRAVGFVRANAATWGGDAERLVLMGHSAGAHLASLVGVADGYTDQAPTCVVSLDTNAYDIPAYVAAAGSNARATYVNAFTDDPATQAEASPISHLADRPGVPVQVVYGPATPRPETADRFLHALAAAGRDADRVAVDLGHDAINRLLGTADAPALTDAVGRFLDGCFGVAVGTDAAPETGALGASPNPTAGRLRLTLPASPAPWRVRVVDVRGRTVRHERVADGELDLSGLATGVYTVVARGGGRVARRRVTVTR